MNADEVRQAIARFHGVDKIRRFIVAGLRRDGRLHYWQEELWNQFIEADPSFAGTEVLLPEVVRYCVLHDSELLPDTVGVIHGCVDRARDYEKDRQEKFPWASLDPYSTEGRPIEATRVDVWYCPGCREVFRESRWGRPRREKR